MTNLKRISSLGAVALGLSLSACGEPIEDFIAAEGSYADGTPISFREQVRRFVCDSTKADAPCVSLMGLRLTAATSELLRGVRISYTPSKMSAQQSYTSGILEPVTLYVVQAKDDRFIDSSVAGGEITFTSIAAMPGQLTKGSFKDMTLVRETLEGLEDERILTIKSGSFQFLQQ